MKEKTVQLLAILIAIGGTAASVVSFRLYHKAKFELAAVQEQSRELARNLIAVQKQQEHVAVPATVEPDVESGIQVDQSNLIKELQAKLAVQSSEISALRFNAGNTVATDVARSNEPPFERRNNWLSNLQTNDPERYKEILDQRKKAQQATKYDIAKKAAHFLNQDVATMTDEEAEQYAKMMDLLDDSLKLSEKLNADLPQDERREIGRTLRDNMRELSPLLESERDKELLRIGKELGYDDRGAVDFANYIHDVIDVTSVNTIFRNSGRAMGWGGGGFGDGNRDQNRPSAP
jgi:hypothetical protein